VAALGSFCRVRFVFNGRQHAVHMRTISASAAPAPRILSAISPDGGDLTAAADDMRRSAL
jgi:hypothetical protein